jgi:hypothetical protein
VLDVGSVEIDCWHWLDDDLDHEVPACIPHSHELPCARCCRKEEREMA